MRLTNSIKSAWVNSVMNDIPKVDYQETAQRLFPQVLDYITPQEIRDAYKDPLYIHYLKKQWIGVCKLSNARNNYYHNAIASIQDAIPLPKKYQSTANGMLDYSLLGNSDLEVRFKEACSKHYEQLEAFAKIRGELTALANAHGTVKTLAAAAPEFAKYLPNVNTATRMVPAITGVVNLVKEAGWPKNPNQPA